MLLMFQMQPYSDSEQRNKTWWLFLVHKFVLAAARGRGLGRAQCGEGGENILAPAACTTLFIYAMLRTQIRQQSH